MKGQSHHVQKRDNKILFIFIILGEIFTLYFSYILGGVWKPKSDIITIMNEASEALKFPFRNYLSQYTLKAVTIGTIIYVLIILVYLTSQRNLMVGKEYGTARFADINIVNKRLSDKDDSKNRILSKNVRMSTDTKITGINNNMLVIGGSGAGKTFYMVKPNIMQMMPKGSFIATDPKGGAKRSIVKSYGTIATNN